MSVNAILEDGANALKEGILNDLKTLRCTLTTKGDLKFEKRVNGIKLEIKVTPVLIYLAMDYKFLGNSHRCHLYVMTKSGKRTEGAKSEHLPTLLEEIATQFLFVHQLGGFNSYFDPKELEE